MIFQMELKEGIWKEEEEEGGWRDMAVAGKGLNTEMCYKNKLETTTSRNRMCAFRSSQYGE